MSEDTRLLVPVSRSNRLRNTVSYAVSVVEAVDEGDDVATVDEGDDVATVDEGDDVAIHFVYPVSQRSPDVDMDRFEEVLGQVTVWVREDLGLDEDEPLPFEVGTAVIGQREYLFSPADYSRVLVEYARDHDLDRIVLDPEYDPAGSTPLIAPLSTELKRSGLTVEQAPVDRQSRRSQLGTVLRPGKFFATFLMSLAFYLLLGDPLYWFDLATGTATALLTAAVLSRVTFVRVPRFGRMALQIGRMALYGPYLLWEIAKANVGMAYVILHPSLPIDPSVVEYEGAVWGSLPTTTLANSITLTPGTLTIDVVESHFYVHALTPATREELLNGALERAVRFVFYGRAAMRIPSPLERRTSGGEEE
ncbi:MAG: monovalent cation/H+ antiporter subunit E [archaeon]